MAVVHVALSGWVGLARMRTKSISRQLPREKGVARTHGRTLREETIGRWIHQTNNHQAKHAE